MKRVNLLRLGGLAAIVVVSLLALGALLGDSGNRGSQPQASSGEAADGFAGSAPDDVMAQIDRALGRSSQASDMAVKSREAAGASVASAAPAAPGKAMVAPNVAPAPPAPTGSSNAGPASAQIDDRKIVQTSSIRLQVKDVGHSFEEVGRIATSAGGFVASSNFSLAGEQQVAAVTIRVPADRYQDTLSQLRALGAKVDSEASNASDVTEQYSDLSARLRTLEATENQLLQLLAKATTVGDILQVQDRLNAVRSDIEQTRGRMSLLDKLTDMATISVSLRPVAGQTNASGGGTNLGDEISRAWQDSLGFLADVAAAVLTVVVFGWWVPLVAVPALLFGLRWLRRHPRPFQAVD